MLKGARPSPAMLVALLALFAALGTGAYAASKIGSSDIQSQAIHKKHVKAPSVSRLYGSGVLGGVARDFGPHGIGNLASEQVAPIGASSSPIADHFWLPAPRRVFARDLSVWTQPAIPDTRRVRVQIRRAGGGRLACTIEGGEQRCRSGKKKLKLKRGQLFDLFIGDEGGGSTEVLPQQDYSFSYRLVP